MEIRGLINKDFAEMMENLGYEIERLPPEQYDDDEGLGDDIRVAIVIDEDIENYFRDTVFNLLVKKKEVPLYVDIKDEILKGMITKHLVDGGD